MFTEFQAQVGFCDFLPCLTGQGLFRGMSQSIFDFPESLAKLLQKQVVLASEVLVKASVGQAGVLHDGRDRGTV